MKYKRYFKILVTLCLSNLCTHVCLANSTNDNAQLLRVISKGIQFYRTTQRDVNLNVNYSETFNTKSFAAILADAAGKDAPSYSTSKEVWIQKAGNIYVSISYLANLNADTGDDQWYEVSSVSACNPSAVTRLETYRIREKLAPGDIPIRASDSRKSSHMSRPSTDSDQPILVPQEVINATAPSESINTMYANVGYINLPRVNFQDNYCQQYYNLDPRYFMYYVDDKPCDSLLTDTQWHATVTHTEMLFGSRCAVIDMYRQVGSKFEVRLWVDLEHQYIIRQVEETNVVQTASGVVFQKFVTATVPDLMLVNGSYYPKAFTSETDLPDGAKSPTVTWFKNVSVKLELGTGVPKLLSSSFTIRWPHGTKIHDYTTGHAYIVQHDGSLKLLY